LEQILDVPIGYFTELEIVRLYNALSDEGKGQALRYVRKLVQREQCKNVVPIAEKLYEYHVYEKMSAGIGSSVYNDQDYDTVYFDEELAHDFASWVSGDSMEPKYQNGSVVLIRETGFDYDGAVYAVVWNSQTFIKKVYREENGLRLVSINKDYKDIRIPYDENPRIVGKIVGDFMPLEV
jgi:putative transcriptional regulator